jgi:predicted phosphoribosyltransferase
MLAELGYQSPVVIGIPPGGMVVAAEVARALEAPLQTLAPPSVRGDHAGARRLGLAGAVVVLVDDQLACTGPVRGAVRRLRRCGAARVILAVPVAASIPAAMARRWVDDLLCAAIRVGEGPLDQFYEDFSGPSEQELAALVLGECIEPRLRSSAA